VPSFKAISTDNLITSHQILGLTCNPTLLSFLHIQKSIFLKVAFFPKLLVTISKKKPCTALDGAGDIHLQSSKSRHLDDVNDKFKIFYVKASVSSGMIFINLSTETE